LTSLTTLLEIMKYMSTPKSAALKDSDVDIADIFGQKYQYHIGVGHGSIDPALIQRLYDQVGLSVILGAELLQK